MSSNVITIGRQFGSGGRELACALARVTAFHYCDKEIVRELSRRTSLSEDYLHDFLEDRPAPRFGLSFGHSFCLYDDPSLRLKQRIYEEQVKILKEFARRGNCIIVGQAADDVLSEFCPVRLFVYADLETRVRRCLERCLPEEAPPDEHAIRREIQKIDRSRAKFYEFNTSKRWGEPENYDLCVNTRGQDLAVLAERLALFFDLKQG